MDRLLMSQMGWCVSDSMRYARSHVPSAERTDSSLDAQFVATVKVRLYDLSKTILKCS